MAKIVPYGQESKQEVLKEYEILKGLHSEKIMALHEAYVTPRYLVLVAEYCTGKELLHSLIDRWGPPSRRQAPPPSCRFKGSNVSLTLERFRYSEDDVVGYLVQILQGVEYLHSRRVLHLDLKPDNIMVTNLNTIKIVDFGSAQSFNPLSLKQKDLRTGSLEYMGEDGSIPEFLLVPLVVLIFFSFLYMMEAPEMVKGEVVGPPADVWSIGVVTFIM